MINFALVQKPSPTYLRRLFPKRVLTVTIFMVFYLSACATSQPKVDRTGDLILFHDGMLMVDKSFSPEAHERALEKFKLLESTAEQMSDAEFGLAIAEIAALSNNGHSGVLIPWVFFHERLAIRFYFADDGLFIADAIPEFEYLVGERVQTLEGLTLNELREIWGRYSTGRLGHRDQGMYEFLETPEALYAAKISSSATNVLLVLENGQEVSIGTSKELSMPKGSPSIRQYDLIEIGRIDGDPLYLQYLEERVRLVELPEYEAVYLQFRSNQEPYEVSRQIQDEIAKKKPNHIIVDQRFNGGGDLSNTRDLMEAIPSIIAKDGKIIVITSGLTFSAGISSVGYLKQAGGSRVTIIGSPIGEELESWAEGGAIHLADSDVFAGFATKRHNYKDGCISDDCHNYMITHPIIVPTLDPDIQPIFTFEMVMSGEDPYLDAAIELIK